MYQEMTSCEIFILIQHQKPIKTPLSSKFLPGVLEEMMFLMNLKVESIGTQHQKPCQDSTCPPSLFLESWRTWKFLMNLEMLSYDRDHNSEASVKVSSRSKIRNPINTPPVLQVFPWSLGGCGADEPGGGVI